MGLKGKIIILVGHTGTIGNVVYEYLKEQGAIVYGASKSNGFDITNLRGMSELKDKVMLAENKIDAVIFCSGIYGPIGKLEEVDPRQWIFTHDVNFFGPVWFTGIIIPIMKKQGFGKLIYLGGGGFEEFPNFSAYTSSKAALIKFAETIAAELKDSNIQVNVISPGLINSDMQNAVLNAGEKAGKFYETLKKAIETGNVANPEYTAELIEYLLDSEITGKVLSAVYDEWCSFEPEYINNTDWLTVKRLDLFTVSRMAEQRDEYRDNWMRSDRD